jgi:hypothetical protein
MDARYRDIYTAVYVNRTGRFSIEEFPPWEPYMYRASWWLESREAVRNAIESSEQYHGRLREDAKALLAVNFQDMVFLPLGIGGRVEFNTAVEYIAGDISTIVGAAVEDRRGENEEISGHAVINALSRSWDRLGISRFELWED